MAYTAKQHYYHAHQHSLAAQGLPSIHTHSTLTAKQHYNLAREHRRAAKGQPANFEAFAKIENVEKKVSKKVDKVSVIKASYAKPSCVRDPACFDMLEGVRRTVSRGRAPRPVAMELEPA